MEALIESNEQRHKKPRTNNDNDDNDNDNKHLQQKLNRLEGDVNFLQITVKSYLPDIEKRLAVLENYVLNQSNTNAQQQPPLTSHSQDLNSSLSTNTNTNAESNHETTPITDESIDQNIEIEEDDYYRPITQQQTVIPNSSSQNKNTSTTPNSDNDSTHNNHTDTNNTSNNNQINTDVVSGDNCDHNDSVSQAQQIEENAITIITPPILPHEKLTVHLRSECNVYPFIRDVITTFLPIRENEPFCENCCCLVCDKKASECEKWKNCDRREPAHCNAFSSTNHYYDALSLIYKNPILYQVHSECVAQNFHHIDTIADIVKVFQFELDVSDQSLRQDSQAVPIKKCVCHCHRVLKIGCCLTCEDFHDVGSAFSRVKNLLYEGLDKYLVWGCSTHSHHSAIGNFFVLLRVSEITSALDQIQVPKSTTCRFVVKRLVDHLEAKWIKFLLFVNLSDQVREMIFSKLHLIIENGTEQYVKLQIPFVCEFVEKKWTAPLLTQLINGLSITPMISKESAEELAFYLKKEHPLAAYNLLKTCLTFHNQFNERKNFELLVDFEFLKEAVDHIFVVNSAPPYIDLILSTLQKIVSKSTDQDFLDGILRVTLTVMYNTNYYQKNKFDYLPIVFLALETIIKHGLDGDLISQLNTYGEPCELLVNVRKKATQILNEKDRILELRHFNNGDLTKTLQRCWGISCDSEWKVLRLELIVQAYLKFFNEAECRPFVQELYSSKLYFALASYLNSCFIKLPAFILTELNLFKFLGTSCVDTRVIKMIKESFNGLLILCLATQYFMEKNHEAAMEIARFILVNKTMIASRTPNKAWIFHMLILFGNNYNPEKDAQLMREIAYLCFYEFPSFPTVLSLKRTLPKEVWENEKFRLVQYVEGKLECLERKSAILALWGLSGDYIKFNEMLRTFDEQEIQAILKIVQVLHQEETSNSKKEEFVTTITPKIMAQIEQQDRYITVHWSLLDKVWTEFATICPEYISQILYEFVKRLENQYSTKTIYENQRKDLVEVLKTVQKVFEITGNGNFQQVFGDLLSGPLKNKKQLVGCLMDCEELQKKKQMNKQKLTN